MIFNIINHLIICTWICNHGLKFHNYFVKNLLVVKHVYSNFMH